jgi:uncharacterized membrane protein YozB (DUF420 family)
VSAQTLPAVNSLLNAVAAILLVLGYVLIRHRKYRAHGWVMSLAFGVSSAFLIGYLYHKYHSPNITMDRFPTLAWGWKHFYWWVILVPHLTLAIVMLPMILRTFWHAWRRRWDRHQRLARWTIGIWLYVSVTGVVIYGLLYHLFPAIGT